MPDRFSFTAGAFSWLTMAFPSVLDMLPPDDGRGSMGRSVKRKSRCAPSGLHLRCAEQVCILGVLDIEAVFLAVDSKLQPVPRTAALVTVCETNPVKFWDIDPGKRESELTFQVWIVEPYDAWWVNCLAL